MAAAPTQDPRERLAETLVCCDPAGLAPVFRATLLAVVADLTTHGIDVRIYETTRCRQLAELYYALGRSKATNELHSWHGFGLAADLISASRGWRVWPEWSARRGTYVGGDEAWWRPVVTTAKAHGLHWGGDWVSIKDCPHFQHHCDGMHESPSDHARALLASSGLPAVWAEVHAA